MDVMKNASEKLIVVKGEASESVSTKLKVVLKKTLNFRHIPVSVMHLTEMR
jgi:hypothetical protein